MNVPARLWWTTIPALIARIAPGTAYAVADGADVRAIPSLAAVAPLLALAAGFGCARALPAGLESYTGSILLTSAMLAIGCVASGLGAWCVLGYAIGDLLALDHHPDFPNWWTWIAALLVSYAVLWMLVVGVPTAARAIGVSLFPKIVLARIIVAGLCGGAFAYLWSQAAAVLIRPLWTFAGGSPTTEAIAPTQTQGYFYGIVAALALAGFGLARASLAGRAAARDAVLESLRARATATALPVPWFARALVRSAFGALLFGGLSENLFESLGIFIVLAVVFAGNELLGERAAYVRALARIPFVLRFALVIGASFAAAYAIVLPAFGSTITFEPVIVAVVVGLAAGAVLFPAARKPVAIAAAILVLAFVPQAAYADNCSGLGDCFTAGQWAVLAAAAIAVAVVAGFAIAAVAAAEAAEAAAAAGAAVEAGEAAAAAEAAAGAEAAAAAEAEAAAAAEAEAAAEAAAEEAVTGEYAAAGDTAADAAADVTGEALESTENAGYPDFNPSGCNTNCGACADAVENALGGNGINPAAAGPQGWPTSGGALDYPLANGAADIEGALQSAGDGARGIAYVSDGANAHVFNVVNNGGSVVAIDGQTGVFGAASDVAGFSGYGPGSTWGFIPTFPP